MKSSPTKRKDGMEHGILFYRKNHMIKPELKNLPLSAYTFLDKMGLLYELYPEATGNWEKDCSEPKPYQRKDLGKFLTLISKCPK